MDDYLQTNPLIASWHDISRIFPLHPSVSMHYCQSLQALQHAWHRNKLKHQVVPTVVVRVSDTAVTLHVGIEDLFKLGKHFLVDFHFLHQTRCGVINVTIGETGYTQTSVEDGILFGERYLHKLHAARVVQSTQAVKFGFDRFAGPAPRSVEAYHGNPVGFVHHRRFVLGQ